MALEVVVLDKDEYKALIDNQADEDELEYLKACQYALESFNRVRGLCPKCKKSVIIYLDGNFHITLFIVNILKLLNKFTYKHTIIFLFPKAINHHIYIILHYLNHIRNKDIPTRQL